MWRAARAVVNWGVAGALAALPGCAPYVQGYAYTTHQTFTSGTSPAAPQPAASPTPAPPTDASASSPPGTHSESSDQLTYYLQGHRLPLVGAQVVNAPAGNHKIILYGFVATPQGKADAEDRTRQFLNEPGAEIDNRIVIRPELLTPNQSLSAATSAFPPSAASASMTAPNPSGTAPAPLQQLQPAQVNELLGALLLGMAIVSTLPTAGIPGAPASPGPSGPPVSASPSP